MLLFPGTTFAALDLITFHTDPETPGPNQAVTISLESYAVDLNSAHITWYIDKAVVKDGIAATSIRTATKDFGGTVTVNAVITAGDGARYDKQFLLKPIEIDLMWEADTFVPPFYKGKALPSYKSTVKVSAIPRFNTLSSNPFAYSYQWTANQIQGLGGGLGKASAIVPMKYSGSPVPVSVKVIDPSGEGADGSSGTMRQNVVAVDPKLLFYEDAPLLGTRFERALTGIAHTEGTSFRVRAVPYFFSTDDMENGNLVYSWQKDSARLASGLDPTTLVIGKVGTAEESGAVQLSVQNRKRILQTAAAAFTVNFAPEQ